MKSVVFSLFILLLLAFSAAGCKLGCKDIHCQNNGECISGGTCGCKGRWGGLYCDSLCAIGYEGTYCNIPSRNKFVRTWNATTSSNSTGVVHHSLTVSNGVIVQQIIISNFNNENYSIVGTMLDYDKFEILSQNAIGNYTGMVNGSGYLNGSNMAVSLTKQAEGIDYFANCNK